MNEFSLKNKIFERAFALGFSACGITPVKEVDADCRLHFDKWLQKGKEARMQYMRNYKDKRFDPRLLVENARSVLVVALNYYPSIHIPENHPQFALYSYGQDYHIVLKEKLNELLKKGNGYLFTSEVEKNEISRTYMAKFVRDNNLEKVAKGIYISEDTWKDELYILQIRYPRIVFSGETALYLHGMIDREYSEINVTVPPFFNRTRLCEQEVVVHQDKREIYELGIIELKTNFGNTVRTYDREKCVCDMIKCRGNMEIQNFQTAIKTYMGDKSKEVSRLLMYAEKLKIKEKVMKYIEVML